MTYRVLHRHGKESACHAGEPSSIPGWGRSPGEGDGNPLQYSSLGNPMNRVAWQATVHRVAKSRTRLSDKAPMHTHTQYRSVVGWYLLQAECFQIW